ncbi:hypothetical protein [Streptomyces sp. NPDC051286]
MPSRPEPGRAAIPERAASFDTLPLIADKAKIDGLFQRLTQP